MQHRRALGVRMGAAVEANLDVEFREVIPAESDSTLQPHETVYERERVIWREVARIAEWQRHEGSSWAKERRCGIDRRKSRAEDKVGSEEEGCICASSSFRLDVVNEDASVGVSHSHGFSDETAKAMDDRQPNRSKVCA